MSRLLLTLFALFSFLHLNAQFVLDGEFRSRGEYRNGYKTIPTENSDPLAVVAQRSRLTANYNADKLTTKLSVQDARIWGEDKWKTDNSGIGLYEAWIKYNFSNQLAIKVGRQELVYDDVRLFTNGNWRTYGESHDAARLMYTSKDREFMIHAGYGVNNDPEAELKPFTTDYSLKDSHHKNIAYLWLHKDFGDDLGFSLVAVRDGFQKADTEGDEGEMIEHPDIIKYRNTIGPYMTYAAGIFDFSGAYYQQSGEDPTGKTIQAEFFSLRAGVRPVKSLYLNAGYDHYSGTDYSSANTPLEENNTFSNLYGPGHKYLGYLDFFGKPAKHGAGVNDLLFRGSYKVKKLGKFQLTLHNFSLDEPYLKTGEEVDKSLGSEIDLVYSGKIDENVSLKAGYSTMFYQNSMERLKGVQAGSGKDVHWGWIMLIVKPTFFTTK